MLPTTLVFTESDPAYRVTFWKSSLNIWLDCINMATTIIFNFLCQLNICLFYKENTRNKANNKEHFYFTKRNMLFRLFTVSSLGTVMVIDKIPFETWSCTWKKRQVQGWTRTILSVLLKVAWYSCQDLSYRVLYF